MTTKLEAAAASMAQNLQAKTGKSLGEWVRLAKKSKLAKHKGIVSFLKTEHGLTHGYANLVALQALQAEGEAVTGDELLTSQYSGSKAGLRSIYEALIAGVTNFGADVVVSPKKVYVSLRRNKQFALVQASTAGRVDVGLNLKGVKPAGRLELSGSFNAMCSHRVRVTSKHQVDKELLGWLKQAYDLA